MKSNNFAKTPINLLNNPKVSLQAKAIYAYIQSKPKSWVFSIDRMKTQLGATPSSIRKAIHELESLGYLMRKKVVNARREFIKYEYILSEKPVLRKSDGREPVGRESIGLSKMDKQDGEKKNKKIKKQKKFNFEQLTEEKKNILDTFFRKLQRVCNGLDPIPDLPVHYQTLSELYDRGVPVTEFPIIQSHESLANLHISLTTSQNG